MKVLIVYESFFGNTEKVARAVAGAFSRPEDVQVVNAAEATPDQLKGVDLLVVGSPTRGFRPSEKTAAFLQQLGGVSLKGVKTAAFDTRSAVEDVKQGFLRFMIRRFGYAAEKIASKLEKNGGSRAIAPAGFYVKDTEGPLKDGELERAVQWGKELDCA